MTSPEMKKAPAATGAIKNRSTNPYQEEGSTMTSIVSEATVNGQTDKFATIHVANCIVAANTMTGGSEPDELVVTMTMPDRYAALTPAEACALAAALQAVAVHQLEQQPREIRRSTAPGTPEFEEAV